MLVTFKTDAHADIIMFGDVALTLLKLMGLSGRVPGALLAAEIATLDPTPRPGGHDEDESGRHVSLANRALPLIDLLSAAAARGKNVMWES